MKQQVILRMSEEEKATIVNKAKEEGLSINEYMKRKVLSNEISERYQDDIVQHLATIEELKQQVAEERAFFRDWRDGINETLRLMNEEKAKLLEERNILQLELEEKTKKSFWEKLFWRRS